MKIAIDCRMLDASGTGVYLRESLPYYIQTGKSFLLFGNSRRLKELFGACANVEAFECGVNIFSVRELLCFPGALLNAINRCDLYYSPFFNIPGGIKIPVFSTIHDMVFPDMPELISKAGLAARMFFYRRAVKRSVHIFTVSEFSKTRIHHYFGNDIPVTVTYSAVKPLFRQYRTGGVTKKPTILFIGNIKKHKGLSILIGAFLQAKNEGLEYTLTIAGQRDKFRSADNALFDRPEIRDNPSIVFTGNIGDDELVTLIHDASLLVLPSLYEGFGLPPLEAMTLGTEALVSDIPVMKEIYVDFPIRFFRSGDAADLKNKLIDILVKNKPQRVNLTEDQLDKYHFKKTANIIMETITKTFNELKAS